MSREIVHGMIALAMVLVFGTLGCGDEASEVDTAIFRDDFENAPQVATLPSEQWSGPDADPVAEIGTWTTADSTGIWDEQVTSYATPGPASGSNYLRLSNISIVKSSEARAHFAGGELAKGFKAEFDLYILKHGHFRLALCDSEGKMGGWMTFGEGTAGVVARRESNWWTNTGAKYALNEWQHVAIRYKYDADNPTMDITIGESSATAVPFHDNSVSGIAQLVFFGGWGSESYLDNVLVTPEAEGGPIAMVPGQKQLFLDDYVVQEMSGLTRTMHQPVKKGAVLKPDIPSDGYLTQIRSAPMWIPDEKIYKVVYLAYQDPYLPITLDNQPAPAYAFSVDGLTWQKPILNQVAHHGSTANNRLVMLDPKAVWGDNRIMNTVYDPHDPDPQRRYKDLLGAEGRKPVVSPDCLHWTKLDVPPIPSDDESQMIYDELGKRFLATVKTYDSYGGRAVSLSISKDFEHWSSPELIFYANEEDREMAREVIRARLADKTLWQPMFVDPEPPADASLKRWTWNCEVYNMAIFPYEGLYIGLPMFFYPTALNPEKTNQDGFHLVQLVMSRDLHRWERLGNRKAFLGPSPKGDLVGVYDRNSVCATRPIIKGDQMWFYYIGSKFRYSPYIYNPDGTKRKKEDLTPQEAADFSEGCGAVCLAILRLDGFISLDAAKEGYVLTKPMTVAGKNLYLNVDAARGKTEVEILDESGRVIPGFSRKQCQAVKGDGVRLPVSWQGGKNISSLAGKTVRFKIYLTNASLYAFGTDFP